MSQTFAITPGGNHSAPTLRQVLSLSEDELTVFTADTIDVDEELFNHIIDAPVSAHILLIGHPDLSGRGFELTFEDGTYEVREFTPATTLDWRYCLGFLSGLANATGADIVGEDGVTYTADSILGFDYRSDILAGITALTEITAEDGIMVQRGIRREVGFTREMVGQINGQVDPVDAYESTFMRIQEFPAFDASQMVMSGPDGEVFGAYVLSEGLQTVLPQSPRLDGEYEGVDPANFDNWKLFLVLETPDGPEMLGSFPYSELYARLPEGKFGLLDGTNLVVERLTRGGDARGVPGRAIGELQRDP